MSLVSEIFPLLLASRIYNADFHDAAMQAYDLTVHISCERHSVKH